MAKRKGKLLHLMLKTNKNYENFGPQIKSHKLQETLLWHVALEWIPQRWNSEGEA